ncbi:MATE family efflux transporter [Phaeovulum vinaykumarii]|uniref:Multidrug-efflux transporter n=1 Tax=Phaeovulum vinaykumarii TaxID=407234 RepID=A0A1N7LKV9_9RHOB|nr:MATE family efflux transporter [Phaeovulum vinaykumarii]SIS74424.1 multidrug resistance protein, MATE family [Phaeovulum vinaykumarii]SOC05019.1 MATE family multidrug resistance protein [Phaeovulum vinaykumarii]
MSTLPDPLAGPRTRPVSFAAHLRATMVLGLPLMGSQLAQMSLHVTDTIMLGWYGVAELAAVVLGAAMLFALFVLGSGFGVAVLGRVAAALGREDDTQVRRDVRMGLWLSAIYGLLTMPVMWFSGPILVAWGQEPRIAELAQDYLRIAGWGMVPALFIMVLKSYLSANERTQMVMWVTLGGVVVNIALNWALIFGHWGAPELGLRGAAISSVVVQATGALALALYAAWLPALRRFALFSRFWRPDREGMAMLFRLGVPIGITGLAEGFMFQAAALMMGWIGTIELAAHGIALEITAMGFMLHMGLSAAATVRVGRADGRGDARGVIDASLAAIVLSLALCVVLIGMLLLVPGFLVGLFLDLSAPESPAIVAFGVKLLVVAAAFQVFDAMQVVGLGLLRGVQDTNRPMWLATFSYWLVGIPASYLLAFPLGLGGVGLWVGLVLGLAAASVLLMWRFWRPRLTVPA